LSLDEFKFKYLEKDKSRNFKINKLYLNPYLDIYNSEIQLLNIKTTKTKANPKSIRYNNINNKQK
ncbi:MAG: hypothetical protein E6319_10345, partial [Anaerococcus vaginalis]|nr:hypothetical protein [Anaerococcus vaginalis]